MLLHDVAETSDEVASTRSRREKRDRLAALLARAGPEEADKGPADVDTVATVRSLYARQGAAA